MPRKKTEENPYPMLDPVPKPPKKNNNRLTAVILLGLLVAALLATGIWFFFIREGEGFSKYPNPRGDRTEQDGNPYTGDEYDEKVRDLMKQIFGDRSDERRGPTPADRAMEDTTFVPRATMADDAETDYTYAPAPRNDADFSEWTPVEFDGYTSYKDQIFPIRLTAERKDYGYNTEYRNGKYYNISQNITFPVNISKVSGNLMVTKTKPSGDFRIEAIDYGGDYFGEMNNYDEGKSLNLYLRESAK